MKLAATGTCSTFHSKPHPADPAAQPKLCVTRSIVVVRGELPNVIVVICSISARTAQSSANFSHRQPSATGAAAGNDAGWVLNRGIWVSTRQRGRDGAQVPQIPRQRDDALLLITPMRAGGKRRWNVAWQCDVYTVNECYCNFGGLFVAPYDDGWRALCSLATSDLPETRQFCTQVPRLPPGFPS